MKITREMYAGACDPYTDLLDIAVRSLGRSPLDGSLEAELRHYFKVGWSFTQAVKDIRSRLEHRWATAMRESEVVCG